MNKENLSKAFIGLFSIVLFLKLLFAATLPVTQDEAYYFAWSKILDFGYFDHPPAISWFSITSRIKESSALFGRLGVICLTSLSFIVMGYTYYRTGFNTTKKWILVMVLGNLNFAGLLFGFLSTPDAILGAAWIFALHEAIVATENKSNRWRWLTAGLVTGFGLLGKFTMLLIGPVFLWGLIKNDPKALKTPWPYAGGLIALLMFSPNLIWNQQHDWFTWKFQLRHGFSLEKENIIASKLPLPEEYDEFSPEAILAQNFIQPTEEEEEEEPKREKTQVEKSLQFLGDFLGSQVAMLGAFIFPIGYALYRRRRYKESFGDPINPIYWAATIVPIGIFTLISLKGKVEGNWAAMYIFSAAPIFASLFQSRIKGAIIAGFINIIILSIAVAHAAYPFLNTKASKDRLIKETHGYKNLAHMISDKSKPVFADSYQIVSMLRFYQPNVPTRQWPGITRPSEYLRRVEHFEENFSINELKQKNGFWLITTDFTPPTIDGFEAKSLTHLYDCVDLEDLQVMYHDQVNFSEDPCDKVVRVWKLIEYINYTDGNYL